MTSSASIDRAQYFLATSRIGFRRWTEDDTDLAVALWGDPEVTQLIDSRGTLNHTDVQQKLKAELQSQDKYGIQYWPIFLKDTGEHVGCCGLRPKDIMTGVMEFGVHIRRDYWGLGLAAEAGRAVIDYAFSDKSAKQLFAGHNPQNQASRHLLQKLGFTYIGDEYYAPTGLMHPSYKIDRVKQTEFIHHKSQGQ